jgi:hypothetical protein
MAAVFTINLALLERNHLVGGIAGQGSIQVREAANSYPFHRVEGPDFARLGATLALGITPTGFSFSQVSLQGAHIAHHQQDTLLLGHLG